MLYSNKCHSLVTLKIWSESRNSGSCHQTLFLMRGCGLGMRLQWTLPTMVTTDTCTSKPRFHHQCIDKCIERMSLRLSLVVSAPSTGVSNVCEAKNVPLQIRNEECMREMHSFNGRPLPPSVYLGRHSRYKIYQASPLRFCILQAIENWMVGRPGNEARVDLYMYSVWASLRKLFKQAGQKQNILK